MRDPYDVLGVARTATSADIKKAYRRLAKKYHPDQNPTDPKAKERFAEVNQAYEVVGDQKIRAKFDSGEIGPDGKPRFGGFEGFGGAGPGQGGGRTFRWSTGGPGGGAGTFSADDILSEILGGFGRRPAGGDTRQTSRGSDVAAAVAVTLEQVAARAKVKVELPTGKTVELALPPGVRSGQLVRLRGQGERGGDALVTIEFVPHPKFRAEGDSLRLDLPVTLDEAVLGAKIRIPTLDGPVTLTIPPDSSGGRSLRLKGKGLPRADGTIGDLIVSLRIVLPEGNDADLTGLAREWRDRKRYSARGDDFADG